MQIAYHHVYLLFTERKKMKKKTTTKVFSMLFAMALVLMMLLSLSVPAQAATKALAVGTTYNIGDTITVSKEVVIQIYGTSDAWRGYCQPGSYTVQKPKYNTDGNKRWEVSACAHFLYDGYNGTENITGIKCVGGDGKYSNPYRFQLVIEKVNVTNVSLNFSTVSVANGGNPLQLTATVSPNNATNKKVQWSVGGTNSGAVKLYTNKQCTTEVGTGATTVTTVYVKGMSVGDAVITVKSNDNNNKSASCSVTVTKANPTYTVPTGLTATYGDTLSSVTLPTGWSWADGTQVVGNAGTNTFKATFTPTDTTNYNVVNNINVSVTVSKATPTYTVPTGVTAEYGKTLSSVALPDGWSWVDGTQTVGNLGPNTFKAKFTPSDANNYSVVSDIDVTVTVTKGTPTYTVPTELTATYGDTLSSVTLPDGWSWADGTQVVGNAGTNTFKAIFTPTDTTNYNVVNNINVSVTVSKATPTYTVPTGVTAEYGKTLSNVALPTGWSWVDGTQTVGNVGQNTFKAIFTPADASNYETIENVDVTINVSPADITPTVSIVGWTYGETAKTPSVSGNTGNGAVAYTYAEKGSNEFSSAAPTEAGQYTVKAEIAATTNYNGAVATADFTVAKANPTYTVPTELSATYGDTLSSVALPDGWSWTNGSQNVGNAGTNTFKAIFTPADAKNYNTITNVDVSVTVSKATPTYTVPSELTATYGDNLSSVSLPEGWAWADKTSGVGNAGTNTFKATFTPSDTNNYNIVYDIDVSVTVNKATPTYTVPSELTATYGDKLSSVSLPEGWAWTDKTSSVGNAGTNTFKAFFTPADTDNYKIVEDIDITVFVEPADITPTVSIDGWTYGQQANKPSVTGNMGNGDVTYSYAKKGSDEFSSTVPTNVGEYTVKADISETANYNGAVTTADFTITKADPKYTTPTNLTATYGDSLKSVKLPAGWEWDVPSSSVGNAGKNRYKATFTPEDTENYNVIKSVYLTITVSKINPIYTTPTGLTATYGDTLADIKLPSGWTWINASESVGDVGIRTFKARYTPANSVNYNTVSNVSVSVSIGKKTISVTSDSKEKTYGDADPALTYSVKGLVGNDTLSGALARDAGENVGEYKINVGTLSAGNNYVLNFTGSTLKISAKNIKVIANDRKKAVDSADPELTYTVEGLVGNDTLSGALSRDAGENVGDYSINIGTLSAGSNYNIIFTGAKLTVYNSDVEIEVDVDDNAPKTKVETENENVAKTLLTDDEKKALDNGEDVSVYLEVVAVDEKTVSGDDKAKIEEEVKKSGMKVGIYLDLTLFKKVGTNDAVAIHDTNGNMIKVTVTVPEELRSTDASVTRTFYVVRVHNGETTILGETTGNEITFKTDKFSTYSLMYKDAKQGGSLAWLWILIAIIAVAACVVVVFVVKKKKSGKNS